MRIIYDELIKLVLRNEYDTNFSYIFILIQEHWSVGICHADGSIAFLRR